jgi:hypothetical protein
VLRGRYRHLESTAPFHTGGKHGNVRRDAAPMKARIVGGKAAAR